MFLRPQSAVSSTAYWVQEYAPHRLDAFVRFTVQGVASFFPGMVTGVAGVTDATPADALPALAHEFLAVVLAVLLIAGIAAAVRDAAGRSLVVVVGGAVLLELIASVVHRWPFGMQRVSVFLLPLLYILMAIGAVRLARLAAGIRRLAWWRYAALGIGAVVLAAACGAAGLATSRTLTNNHLLIQHQLAPGYRAAVVQARPLATVGDLVVIRSDEAWYGDALGQLTWTATAATPRGSRQARRYPRPTRSRSCT